MSLSEIDYARVYTPLDTYWSIEDHNFDRDEKLFSSLLCYSGVSPHFLPIGKYEVEIKLKGGYSASYKQTFPAPGSTSTEGNTHVYTEDYVGGPPPTYTPMVKRATITGSSIGANVDIDFNVNDGNVYSGWVWFYGSERNYVGSSSSYLRDYSTGVIASIINGGASINTNGTNNDLIIEDGEIDYESGYSLSDIDSFVLILTDGGQYSGSSDTYDCRSRSAYTSF